jgi:hypothetical protein
MCVCYCKIYSHSHSRILTLSLTYTHILTHTYFHAHSAWPISSTRPTPTPVCKSSPSSPRQTACFFRDCRKAWRCVCVCVCVECTLFLSVCECAFSVHLPTQHAHTHIHTRIGQNNRARAGRTAGILLQAPARGLHGGGGRRGSDCVCTWYGLYSWMFLHVYVCVSVHVPQLIMFFFSLAHT